MQELQEREAMPENCRAFSSTLDIFPRHPGPQRNSRPSTKTLDPRLLDTLILRAGGASWWLNTWIY